MNEKIATAQGSYHITQLLFHQIAGKWSRRGMNLFYISTATDTFYPLCKQKNLNDIRYRLLCDRYLNDKTYFALTIWFWFSIVILTILQQICRHCSSKIRPHKQKMTGSIPETSNIFSSIIWIMATQKDYTVPLMNHSYIDSND